MTNIFAYDLSLRSTGIAQLSGGLMSLSTSKTTKAQCDLQEAVRVQSGRAVQAITTKPDVVIMESGALGAIRGQGYEELGALRWLIRDHARHQLGLKVVEITPSHLKKAVTGNGRADKAEVMAAVRRFATQKFWPQPANNDEADAAALVITYLMDTNQWRIDGQLQGTQEPGADGAEDGPVPF
jgi:Holliday junction resolvasome RuvABC endonuclease subunit